MILYFFEHRKILPFTRSGSSINDLQLPILPFVPVLCIVVSVISHATFYVKLIFEDNTLLGGENDMILSKAKIEKTNDNWSKYQLIWKWNQIWIVSLSDYYKLFAIFDNTNTSRISWWPLFIAFRSLLQFCLSIHEVNTDLEWSDNNDPLLKRQNLILDEKNS